MQAAGNDVMHISTALAPGDRETVVERIRARLKDEKGKNWTLVATSCVEAGVDFSFRSAVRESCSVASAVQTGGRVNRHGEWEAAEVWDVRLSDPVFNQHPSFKHSRRVMAEMVREGALKGDAAALVSDAMRRELIESDVREDVEELLAAEHSADWPEVSKLYRVIDSDTQTVVVDHELVKRIQEGERPKWRELVRGSVQMWRKRVKELAIRQLDEKGELFYWTGPYDPEFLGYMTGSRSTDRGQRYGLLRVMFTEDDLLPLSGLQHLVFCERQWALIHIEQQWEENRLTAEGRVLHEQGARSGDGDAAGHCDGARIAAAVRCGSA